MPIAQLQRIVYASLMAALIAVGAYIHIPIGPVPIVLQNLFVFLAGLLLGGQVGTGEHGNLSPGGSRRYSRLFGGKGGNRPFHGTHRRIISSDSPSPRSLRVSSLSGLPPGRFGDAFALVAAVLVVYVFGVPWLKFVTDMTWTRACVAGMAPFLPGDVLKAVAAFFLARSLRPILNRQLNAPTSSE